jgi:hypothetical protein
MGAFLELFEERAGIIQYDGGLDKSDAEMKTIFLMTGKVALSGPHACKFAYDIDKGVK